MPAAGRHRAHDRKPKGDKPERQFRTEGTGEGRRSKSGGGAARPLRPFAAAASAALLGASLVTASPAAAALPTPPALRVASADVRLAAAANILNIPINMAIDLFNAPYNEVQAVEFFSKSLFFSGTWFVVSPTNLWGVDPGDPGHFRSTVNFLLPFPALSGMNLDQMDENGMGQQVWKFVAVMLPVSGSCDAYACTPNVPTSPITGMTGIDSLLWIGAMLTGTLHLPLTDNWFDEDALQQVLTSGYTFGPNYEGYADPSGPVNPMYGTAGTHLGPNGENLMEWSDTTFKLDLSRPFVSYLDHLMADPAGNPMQLPSLEQIGRAFQSLAAAFSRTLSKVRT